jgi:DNA-binding HxlR family transcriptional regulator
MNEKKHNTCPIAKVAILLSDPWTMLIIRDVLKKKMRFSDFEHSLDGISTRTLAKKIKQLEQEEIIKKEENYYTITKKGSGLDKIIKSMLIYGEKYF